MASRLYIVEQRAGGIEVRPWYGTKTAAYMQRSCYAEDLTRAMRRARAMAGERPGLILEEMPIVSQDPLVFVEAPRR